MGLLVDMSSIHHMAECGGEPYQAGDEVFWGNSFDLDKVGVILEAFQIGVTPSVTKYPALHGQIKPFGDRGYVVAVTRGDKNNPTGDLRWLLFGMLSSWSMIYLAFDIALDSCMSIIENNSVKVTKNGVTSFDLSDLQEKSPAFKDVSRAAFFLSQSHMPLLVRDKKNPFLFTYRQELAEAQRLDAGKR